MLIFSGVHLVGGFNHTQYDQISKIGNHDSLKKMGIENQKNSLNNNVVDLYTAQFNYG